MNNIPDYINTIVTQQNNDNRNSENYNSLPSNKIYNYNIFFKQQEMCDLSSFLEGSANVTKIDTKHLTSMDDFMIFVNKENFLSILSSFHENILEFAKVASLYLEEESTRKCFNESIDKLIAKIQDTKNYPLLGSGVINLFNTTRNHLFQIVQIIKKLSQYHQNSQSATEAAKYFYSLCNISYDNLKNLIYNSITDLDACINGVNARFIMLYNHLEAAFAGKLGLFSNKKNDLIKILIQDIEIDLINHSIIKYNSSLSVHFHISIRNTIAEKFGLQAIKDEYSDNINIDDLLKDRIINITALELLAVNISRSLADDLIEKFTTLLTAHNCSHWLDQSLPSDYFLDNSIFVDLDNNFFSICNACYASSTDEPSVKSELQKNNLSFYNLIEVEYKNNNDFFNIKDIDIKLHAWIVSSYLPPSTYKIIADISNQHLITDEHNLAIATMGNCYFWVINKKLIENKKLFDFNNHTPIQLKHIPFDICNNTVNSIYTPLIIQALKQTNDAKEIIRFFNSNDIYNIVNNNLSFTKYLNNILSKKVLNNIILKKNMVNIICNDTNYTYNVDYKKIFNYQNAYWFTDSVLLEPVLKQMVNNDIDICSFINRLTISHLLNFENKFSLRNLCNSILSKQQYNTINSNYFYNLFTNLEFFSSKAAKYLLYSGLIDDVLLNFTDKQNNNILMMAIIKRDIEAINLLTDFNQNLDATKKIKINLQNKQQKTALILATETGNCEYIQALVNFIENNKIDFNKTDYKGFTALMHATRGNYPTVIMELFRLAFYTSNNINCDIKNNNGYTAMMLAVHYNHYDSLDSLMSVISIDPVLKNHYYMDINIKNYSGETTLTLILKHSNLSMLVLFLTSIKKCYDNNSEFMSIESFQNAITHSLFHALSNNVNEEICYNLLIEAQRILKLTINFNLANQNGNTLLMVAILYNKPIFIEHLLNLYVKYNRESLLSISNKNNLNETAILLSTINKKLDCLRVLLNCCDELNIHVDNEDIETAIKYAWQKIQIEHIILLNEFKKNHKNRS